MARAAAAIGFGLALLAPPAALAAPEDFCPALAAMLADGQPRQVVIGWPRPAPTSNEQAEARARSGVPPPPPEPPLFARVTAQPDDDAADAFRAATYRITHYWSFERLAGAYVGCLRADGYAQKRMTAAGSAIRAELVSKRGRRVVVEASQAACAKAPPELERDQSCLLIEAAAGRKARPPASRGSRGDAKQPPPP